MSRARGAVQYMPPFAQPTPCRLQPKTVQRFSAFSARSADLPPDPRHTQLGARGPVPLRDVAEGVPPYSGELLGLQHADERAYRLQRYQLGIAEGTAEIPSGTHCSTRRARCAESGRVLAYDCCGWQALIASRSHQIQVWEACAAGSNTCESATQAL